MSSRLTTTADVTKKGAIVLGIAVVVVIVLRQMYFVGVSILVRPTPTPSPRVETIYGKLPQLVFPDSVTRNPAVTYRLETIDGKLVTSSPSAMIYETAKKTASLDFAEKAAQTAGRIGFPNIVPEKISDTTYLFQDPADLNKNLQMDFVYYNIKYKYGDMASYISLDRGVTPSIDTAKNEALRMLSSVRPELIGFNGSPLTFQSSDAIYTYVNPTTLEAEKVNSQPQANITKVNVYHDPIGKTPVIGPSTTDALMNFVYTGIGSTTGSMGIRLLSSDITYWTVLNNKKALYPLRSVDQAWAELNQGKGFVLNEVKQGDTYNVRNIYLAYYEPPTFAPFFQPVWVFEGDKEGDSEFIFRAIVPAVASQFME